MTEPVKAPAPDAAISFRLPLDLKEWLEAEARAEFRSMNGHLVAILTVWRQTQQSMLETATNGGKL